jgi:hypothetical protein
MFVVAVIIERNQPAHNESTEIGAETVGEGHDESTVRAATPADGSETVLGVDAESALPVAVAVTVSLVLAAGLWLSGRRSIAVLAALVAAVLTVFDIAEVAHQLNESRHALAVLAAAIAVGHAAVVLISADLRGIKESLA